MPIISHYLAVWFSPHRKPVTEIDIPVVPFDFSKMTVNPCAESVTNHLRVNKSTSVYADPDLANSERL